MPQERGKGLKAHRAWGSASLEDEIAGLKSIGAAGHAGASLPATERPTIIEKAALEGGGFEKVY